VAFKSGRLAEVSVATKLLGAFCNATDLDISVDTPDTTTQGGTSWKTAISGLAGATLTLSGYYDPTVTTGPASVITLQIPINQGGTSTAIIYYPAGNNAGQGTSHTFSALIQSYKESPAVGGTVAFSATLLATGADTIAQL
jgi:hypothetical protein